MWMLTRYNCDKSALIISLSWCHGSSFTISRPQVELLRMINKNNINVSRSFSLSFPLCSLCWIFYPFIFCFGSLSSQEKSGHNALFNQLVPAFCLATFPRMTHALHRSVSVSVSLSLRLSPFSAFCLLILFVTSHTHFRPAKHASEIHGCFFCSSLNSWISV